MASYRSAPDPRDTRRRAVSIALTVAAHLLIALLLLTLAPPILQRDRDQRTLSTFDVAREPGSAPKAAEAPKKARETAKKAAAAKPAAAARAERPAPPTETPPPPPVPSLWGDRSLFAGGDIGKIRSADSGADSAAAGAGSGRNSGSVYGPGEGPGGSRLYNAEWFRRPSHAEIAGYMPAAGVPAGAWGEIACKTIPGNQVDNCRQLGESPPGSGISRGLRQAAWQFRVLPPRIDGRPMIGAWVRIHFDFTERGEGDAR